jgi:hypothetical protein
MELEGYVTKTELARHLRVCTRTIDNMMARNDIPYLVLGRIVRFKISEVDHSSLNPSLLDCPSWREVFFNVINPGRGIASRSFPANFLVKQC